MVKNIAFYNDGLTWPDKKVGADPNLRVIIQGRSFVSDSQIGIIDALTMLYVWMGIAWVHFNAQNVKRHVPRQWFKKIADGGWAQKAIGCCLKAKYMGS